MFDNNNILTINKSCNFVGGNSGEQTNKLLNIAFTHNINLSSQSIPVNTVTNISGMSCTINKQSATSLILVQIRWNGANELATESGLTRPQGFTWQITRNEVAIGNGDSGNGQKGFEKYYVNSFDTDVNSALGYYSRCNIFYPDLTSETGNLTYSLAAFMPQDSCILHTNFGGYIDPAEDNPISTSTIILQEIQP